MFEYQKPSRKDSHLRWSHLRLEPGSTFKGWICGPLVGVTTHWNQGTRPCRDKITLGALSCSECIAKHKSGWAGYLPLFDVQGKKWVALTGRDSEDYISRLSYGCAVKITKGKYRHAPLVVQEEQWTVAVCPYLGQAMVPHDIRAWLLHLWGDEELEAYCSGALSDLPLNRPETAKEGIQPSEKQKMPQSDIPVSLKERYVNGPPKKGKPNGKPESNGTH